MASKMRANPGLLLYGPVWPNPVTLRMTRFGWIDQSVSRSSPHASSVPGRKFSISTSKRGKSCLSSATPSRLAQVERD